MITQAFDFIPPGFEPEGKRSQDVDSQCFYANDTLPCPHIGPQSLVPACPRLTKVFKKWEALPEAVKAGIEAMIDTIDP